VQSEPEDFLLSQILLIRAIHGLGFKTIFITWRNIHYSSFGIPYKFGWVYRFTEYLGLRYGDYCFSFNAAGRETLGARGFHALDVISPAIDTNFFRPMDANALRQSMDLQHFTVGFFGRFVAEKGIGVLLDAIAGLDHPVQLLMVGNGPAWGAWMEQARKLKIAHKIIHKPSVLRREMPIHICACNAVVLPSYASRKWKEQFGRILVEAMACGVPVFGARSGEIPNVIGDAGLVFPEKDVPSLRDCLRQLVEDFSLRERLSVLGRARAENEYSCEVVANAWLRAIGRLLENARSTTDCNRLVIPNTGGNLGNQP
jgi:glycosyltransferase involved in cell wall biosynthesis